MKNSIKKKIRIATVSIMMLSTVVLYAQPGFDDTVDDAPVAPIHSLVILAMAAGAALGVKRIFRKED